jgi:hypothetical protein
MVMNLEARGKARENPCDRPCQSYALARTTERSIIETTRPRPASISLISPPRPLLHRRGFVRGLVVVGGASDTVFLQKTVWGKRACFPWPFPELPSFYARMILPWPHRVGSTRSFDGCGSSSSPKGFSARAIPFLWPVPAGRIQSPSCIFFSS